VLEHREVEAGEIVDVHERPALGAVADEPQGARFGAWRVGHEARESTAVSVDDAGRDDRRVDAGGEQTLLLRHTPRDERRRVERPVVVEVGSGAVLPHAARQHEATPAVAERADRGVDDRLVERGRALVGHGSVDRRVDAGERLREPRDIRHVAFERGRAARRDPLGGPRVACDGDDLVARIHERIEHGRSDVSGSPGQ
jgi:hypothetical protein